MVTDKGHKGDKEPRLCSDAPFDAIPFRTWSEVRATLRTRDQWDQPAAKGGG